MEPLLELTAVIVLGIGAQWLAWRLRLPSILLLLIVGFVAGPVTGMLNPDKLLGDLLFPIVSLSVAIILFEGGLNLDIAELREIGRVIRNLITIGVLVAWASVTALAYFIFGFDLALALLLGAILVVTGPTVILPLLRHIKPSGRIASTVKWEGIVNDPIGAILAVLMFKMIEAGGFGHANEAAAGIAIATLTGGLFGFAGAALVIFALQRYWIPDYLQNPAALTTAVAVFALSNAVQAETGLLAVTIMGSVLASQKLVSVRHIVEFKENLRVLLVSVLFIILAARVPLSALQQTGVDSLLFLAALILLIRPLTVVVATIKTGLSWQERFFLGVMAPRGIVAAAVASIFALELTEIQYPGADRLTAIVFVVIVGTVTVYGLSAAPVARWLGLATPNPQGLLIAGADPWIRSLAELIQQQGFKVLLVDTNWTHAAAARQEGLNVHYGNVLDERAMDDLDLDGVGRFLALTPNDEVNALAALHFGEVFDRKEVYQLPSAGASQGRQAQLMPQHLRGRFLFAPDATHDAIANRIRSGATFKKTSLTPEFGYDRFKQQHGENALPLFAIKDSGDLTVFAAKDTTVPKAGHTLISLVGGAE